MLSIKEVADKYGLKKATVHARLRSLEKKNPSVQLTKKSGNKILLTEEGLALLEKSLRDNPVGSRRSVRPGGAPSQDKDQFEDLKEELKEAKSEIKRLQALNERLTDTIIELAKTANQASLNSQGLVSQQQSLSLIDKKEHAQEKKKHGIIARLAVAGRVIMGDYS